MAVEWAVTDRFRPYIEGVDKFFIISDHNPLIHIHNLSIKNRRLTKIRLKLAEFNYTMVYKKGELNANADSLSRMYEKNVLSVTRHNVNTVITTPFNDTLISKYQKSDSRIQPVLKVMNDKNVDIYENYIRENDVLYALKEINGTLFKRIVVPAVLKDTVLTICHDDMSGAHLGFKKTWSKLQRKFYWPQMHNDTEAWLKSCSVCASKKKPNIPHRAPLYPITHFTKPFEMVGVDVLGPLPTTQSGNKYIVVFSDYLTKWPEAYAVRNADASTISKLLVNEILPRHGAPDVLLSDRGTIFLSTLVLEVCKYLTIRKVNTTAYHPQTDGLVERFNDTLCKMLSIYSNSNQSDWDQNIPIVLFAYRISVQETTTYSPFQLLYNREARLPSSLDKSSTHPHHIITLDKLWTKARANIASAAITQKIRYDERYPSTTYKIGDMVRLHWPATQVGQVMKLRKDLYRGPYKIIEIRDEGNVLIQMEQKQYLTHVNRIKPAETTRTDLQSNHPVTPDINIPSIQPQESHSETLATLSRAASLDVNPIVGQPRTNSRYNLRSHPLAKSRI